MAWTARNAPRSWWEEVRESSGWALLAGLAGSAVASGMGAAQGVHFATERVVRGADGGEVA